ncbi:type I-E CRISPR-associated protein Cse1/CasA [Nesterenkonia aerolata]|uniref:Type I-E CRISPR-associated protein Cse1/CasA n=1 Tax=Nesterenkonia aerolata TaxID=3074079 RepID=A0ABU2DS55_9MICC|nr:type I-E CRISPR-associated protein Cse1/CasA [Nesterenkonia sp. LY-0111]MDR8019336.1 type I-E CRISPR-associated protein Cse1/CasA [Nesterenkonia sp. LY-0111]
MVTDQPQQTENQFNLLDESWITCLMLNRQEETLSLRDLFTRCHEISRISGDSPHQATSILRLALAIFWRAHLTVGTLGTRRTDPEQWWSDSFADDSAEPVKHTAGNRVSDTVIGPVHHYLEAYTDRFALFHPSQPFFQVSDLHKADGSHLPVSRLIPEAENDYFTLRAGTGPTTLSYPEAARWLVCIQAYDYSGIKPGAVGDPRVKNNKGYPIGPGWTGQAGIVVLHGRSLRETLLLNTPASFLQALHRENPQDLPPWERHPDGPAPRAEDTVFPEGPCDVLTWQSRRVRLGRGDGVVTGVLVSNGDKIENKNQFFDPMTAYRYSKNQSSKLQTVHMPQEHDPDLTVWRGLAPMLHRTPSPSTDSLDTAGRIPTTVDALQGLMLPRDSEDFTVVTELVGAKYGAQQSSHTDTINAILPLRMSLLLSQENRPARTVVNAAQAALDATVALGQFAGHLRQAAGGDYSFQPLPRESVLHELQAHFARWIVTITPTVDLNNASSQWEDTVRQAVLNEASTLLRSVSPRVMIGTEVEGDPPRLVSGSSAWTRLHRRLDDILPTTARISSNNPTAASTEGA